MSKPVAPTPDDIARICRDPKFVACFEELEQVRRHAARTFLRRMFNVTVILGLIVVALTGIGWWPLAVPAFIVPFVFALVFAFGPLGEVADLYTTPLLAGLADAAGLGYHDHGASPPVFDETRETLFALCDESARRAEDMFEARGADGPVFYFWQATLSQPLSRGSLVRFIGRFHAFPRRGDRVEVIVTPAGHDFGKDGPQRELVRIGDGFDWRFKVHATDPVAARRLLDPDFRALLRKLRRRGPLFVHIRPDIVIVGVSGPGFRAGGLFRTLTANQRLAKLNHELGGALALQAELIARLA